MCLILVFFFIYYLNFITSAPLHVFNPEYVFLLNNTTYHSDFVRQKLSTVKWKIKFCLQNIFLCVTFELSYLKELKFHKVKKRYGYVETVFFLSRRSKLDFFMDLPNNFFRPPEYNQSTIFSLRYTWGRVKSNLTNKLACFVCSKTGWMLIRTNSRKAKIVGSTLYSIGNNVKDWNNLISRLLHNNDTRLGCY